MKRACDSFTPSKWAKWKCAVCFFSDKEHGEAANSAAAPAVTTRRKPTLVREITGSPAGSSTPSRPSPSVTSSPSVGITKSNSMRRESGFLSVSAEFDSPMRLKLPRSTGDAGGDPSDSEMAASDGEQIDSLARASGPFKSSRKEVAKPFGRPRFNTSGVPTPTKSDGPGDDSSPANNSPVPLWRQKLLKKAKELKIAVPADRTDEEMDEAASSPRSASSVGSKSSSQELAQTSPIMLDIPKRDPTDESDFVFGTPPAASPRSISSPTSLNSGIPILAHQPPPEIEASRVPTSEEEQLQRELEARYALLAEDKKTAQEEERARRVEEAKKRVLARKLKEHEEKNAPSGSVSPRRDGEKSKRDLELEALRTKEREEERKREEELEKQRLEEEERLAVLKKQEEELNRKEAERKARLEEEERKREEKEKAKKEADELRSKLEEERAQKEVEREAKEKLRMEKLEKAKQKQNLRESAMMEKEKKRKDEEVERKKQLQIQKAEAERKRKERDEKKREEEMRRKQEEEARRLLEEEERKREEEERKRQEEERAQIEAQRSKREEEEKRRREEMKMKEEENERQRRKNEEQQIEETESEVTASGLDVKNWNAEFQELEEVDDDDLYKFTAMAALVKDFCSVTEAYGRVIISERFLPVKTIEPLSTDGNVYVAHGILFKLLIDEVIATEDGEPIYRFGGDCPDHETAMKAAHSALQAHSALYHCRVPGLCYPMVALINYRGYSILASALLPIGNNTVIYGLDEDGLPKFDENIHDALKTVAIRLNLTERTLNGRTYIGPENLKVHKGYDGRAYVVNYDFLMPREASSENIESPRQSYRLRPRLVAQSSEPLVSDVLDNPSPASPEELSAVEDITAAIYEDVIPRVASIISTGRLSIEQIMTQLHHHGLSFRHLGFIREALPRGGEAAKVRQLILTECVARAVKNRVRHELRESLRVYKTTSEEPYRRTVYQAFKPVLSYQTSAPAYFENAEGSTIPVKIDIEHSMIYRGDGMEDQMARLEANFSLPIPWRQKSFFFETRVESDTSSFVMGLCGTAPHNVLKDVTGYCVTSDGLIYIQGKTYPCPFKIQRGDTVGLFYNWRGREIIFTINDRIGYSVSVAKGAYIPKIDIGTNTRLVYTFGPNFVFDIESLSEQLSIESCIIEDESAIFWQQDIKMALENYFPHCLSEDELPAHISLRESVDLSLLAQRIQNLTGIVLSERVHEYLREDPVSTFTLAPYDISRLDGTTKTMDIADFSQGVIQLIDVIQRGFKLEKETAALLQPAFQKLEAVYLNAPVTTPQHYFYYAQYYHHASLVYMLDPSATTLRYQRTALLIYNEALQSYSQEREEGDNLNDADSQKRVHWQILLNKGILLCEMEAEEEAVSLFYQVRGGSDEGDELLMNQLELYKNQLVKVTSQEHAIRITALSNAIGRAIIDPCNSEACLSAAQVIIAGLRFLLMAQSADSWDEKYSEYIEQIKKLFDAIQVEDTSIITRFLEELFSHPVDHNILGILIQICSACSWLIPMLSHSLENTEIIVIHPSQLLRRIVTEHGKLFSGKSLKKIEEITAAVVETRSVNQWKRVKPQSITPPPLYGASLTSVDRVLYLFGGNDGTTRRSELFSYDIGTNRWELVEARGEKPAARQDHSAILIGNSDIVIWGGRSDEGFLNDAFMFNVRTSTWVKLHLSGDVPSPRSGFTPVRVGPNEVWILGGKAQGASIGFGEAFVLNLKSLSFEKKSTWGQIPVPDYNFFATCSDGEVIFKFGGEIGGNDLYALHTSSLRWYFINTGGKYPSYDNAQDSLSYISIRDKLVMFGLPKDVFALHLGVIPKGNPLYTQNFDPMGSELAHANWRECDSSDFPTEERKYFAACTSGNLLYTHGGQDADGRPLDAFYVYSLEANTWERVDSDFETDEPLPELYGHSMSLYNNKIFIFGGLTGGMGIEEAESCNKLYCLDIETKAWTRCEITTSDSRPLISRAFHAAIVFDNLLYLVGGLDEEAHTQIDVINLDSFTAESIVPSGQIPKYRVNAGLAVAGKRLFVLGGLLPENKGYQPLDTVDILDLSAFSWSTEPIRGEAPEPCEGLSLAVHGKYILKYGGHNSNGSTGHLSILNTETMIWDAEIDLQTEPMPGHFTFIMDDKLIVIEQGFEMAFLDIDAGDRLGLFRRLHTYGKRHLGKRAACSVVGETNAYIYGGRTSQGVSQQFSIIDLEVDCFREEEKELQQLPSFAALNRHIMVLATEVRGLGGRPDDEVTDAFVCANDAEWPFARQQSPIVKASLQPTFDFQFYFYNIESRTEASVLIEVRDGKDQFFYGAASVPLKMSLKLLSKPKAPLFYEKTFKLSDPHGESPTPVSGEITLKVIGF